MCTKVEIQRYMKREEEREICRSIDPRRLEKISSGGLAEEKLSIFKEDPREKYLDGEFLVSWGMMRRRNDHFFESSEIRGRGAEVEQELGSCQIFEIVLPDVNAAKIGLKMKSFLLKTISKSFF